MKLFVMSSRVPWPLDKGDKLRMYHQIKHLSIENDIYLVAISDRKDNNEAKRELLKYCKQVHIYYNRRLNIIKGITTAFFKAKPLQIGYFYNPSIAKRVDELIDTIRPDHIYGQLIRVAEYINHYNIPKTLDLQDAFSAGLKRRSEKSKAIFKQVLKLEYSRVLDYESNCLDTFDYLTIITQADKDLLSKRIQPKVSIVPNGVDMSFFKPIDKKKKYDLVFTGNMNYPPNIDAAEFLVNEILPKVWKLNSDVTLLIAGAAPNVRVKKLEGKNVKVSGWLDDIRDAYSQSRVFIAPMQIGTGLQNKLLEAMAMKIPTITSELANNALKAKPGIEILVADKNDSELFSKHIFNLLNDTIFSVEISNNAYSFVEKNYNWQASVEILNKLWN